MATPDPTPVSLTGDKRIDGLIEPSNWISDGESLLLTWSPHDFGGGQWTEAGLYKVQQAFDTWSAVANITFVRVDDPNNFRATGADIAVVATGTRLGEREDAAGLAFTPDPFYTNFELLGTTYNAATYPDSQGDMFIDDPANGSFEQGTFGFHVLVHEIGHALGLKHPHDGPYARTFDELGLAAMDNLHHTVMSYNNPQGADTVLGAGWTESPMPLDILAVQYLYGANMNYHAGNDTYVLSSKPSFLTLWDTGGTDTIVVGNSNGWTIRLGEGEFSSSGSRTALAVAYNVTIEHAVGGRAPDRIFGNGADNHLSGEGGNDRLDGRRGADELEGGPGHDTLLGGPGGDMLYGNARVDDLRGGGGDDVLDGGPGRDELHGEGGADVLLFNPNDTYMDGGAGLDILRIVGTGKVLDPEPGVQELRGIEILDLQGEGTDTVVLTRADVLAMPDKPGRFVDDDTWQVMIRGSHDDAFISVDQGWIRGADVILDEVTFAVYGAGKATVLVEAGVDVFLDFYPDAEFTLDGIDGRTGFEMVGTDTDPFATTIGAAGDFNGDGFDDFLVAAATVNANDTSGSVFVVFGGPRVPGGTLSSGDLDGDSGFRIVGAPGEFGVNLANASIGSCGDINGDGLADIIIGTGSAEINGSHSGAVYVIYGTASPMGPTFNLSTLDGGNGFRIVGDTINRVLGTSARQAGDINGDGYDDLLLHGQSSLSGGGACYVLFGGAAGYPAVIDPTALDGSNGFSIHGESSVITLGNAAAAGDVNGDGFDDILVGASGTDANGADSGAAFIVFGRADGFAPQLLAGDLDGNNGFQVAGAAAGDYLGGSASAAGDVNGDGYDDFVVGAQGTDSVAAFAGAAHVIFGSGAGFAPVLQVADLDGTNGFSFYGQALGDIVGLDVSGAGDVNGDGFDDVLVGARGVDHSPGEVGSVFVLYGHAGPFGNLGVDDVNGANGFGIPSGSGSRGIGDAVRGLGDVNGDGLADFIIGAVDADVDVHDGKAYILFGADRREDVDFAGTARADVYRGTTGADVGLGARGSDVLSGLGGADVLTGARGDDTLAGGKGADLLRGGAGTDILQGGAGVDRLLGGDGADRLSGGADADVLTGGRGADQFVFDGIGAGMDTIMDFGGAGAADLDVIVLDRAVFSALGTAGDLDPANLVVGVDPVAADGNDFILYDSGTGALYYDADGSGAGAALQFALLATAPDALDATDFIVI